MQKQCKNLTNGLAKFLDTQKTAGFMLTINQCLILEKKMKSFKNLSIGQVFDTEFILKNQFIRGIKKSSRTGLMLLNKNDTFIMYFSKNTKVKETNIFTVI